MSLTSQVIETKDVNDALLKKMFQLMDATYHGSSLEKIKRDLLNKHYLLLLFDENQCLQGFTTMQIFDSEFRERPVKIIYSGDTVISDQSRGEIELMRAWWQFSVQIQNKYAGTDVYWMLISKGWRTYKFFPLFLQEFYPTYTQETPDDFQDFINRLGMYKFPDEYKDGLVFPNEPDFLKNADTDVPEHRRTDPDILFFLDKNKTFMNGTELVCVALLRPDNLTKIGHRLLNGERS